MSRLRYDEELAFWLEEFTESFSLGDFTELTGVIAAQIKEHAQQGATDQEWLDSQAMDVVEEAGEFIGEYRRLRGFARRAGDREKMLSELSDVIIASMIMFYLLDADPEDNIRTKLRKIITRGYVNKES